MSKDLFSNNTHSLTSLEKTMRIIFITAASIFIFFLGQFIGVVLAIVAINLFSDSASVSQVVSDSIVARFGLLAIISATTLALLYGLFRFAHTPFLKGIGLDKKPQLKEFGVAGASFIVYASSLFIILPVLSTIIPQVNLEQAQQLGFSAPQGYELIFVFFALVVIPPILEEILFRGYLYKRLRGLLRIRYAAVITSILFAIAHLEAFGDNPLNWAAAVDTLVLSGFLIYLVEKYKSLWPSIFLHAIKNAVAFTFLFLV